MKKLSFLSLMLTASVFLLSILKNMFYPNLKGYAPYSFVFNMLIVVPLLVGAFITGAIVFFRIYQKEKDFNKRITIYYKELLMILPGLILGFIFLMAMILLALL